MKLRIRDEIRALRYTMNNILVGLYDVQLRLNNIKPIKMEYALTDYNAAGKTVSFDLFTLTKEQYQKLLDKYGVDVVHKACVKLDNFIKTEGYIPFRTPAMALGRRFCNIAKAELDADNREEKLEP